MDENVYVSNYIGIIKKEDGYYIESYKNGMQMFSFNKIISNHPEIKITSFMVVKTALLNAPQRLQKFAEKRDRITVEISNDELKASVILCVREDELFESDREKLCKEIVAKLKENGVVFGIREAELSRETLRNNTQILAAEGLHPISGADSVINMYKMKEAKPEVKDGDKVDHYELNLINKVGSGEWLGERIDPVVGKEGRSVKGTKVEAKKGKVLPLLYDKKNVEVVYETGKTVLYSRQPGAVHFHGDRVGVSNHLEITQNVDFKTGNIDFDGYLTIKGTVEDGFSVTATKDIEILGEYGVGNIKEIISKEGSIYIKGGIAGKNKAVLKAKKNIFTKYVSDTTIESGGSVHIGFYCFNSNIKAQEVILDSSKGKIMGGRVTAEIKVISSTIGSTSEKKTHIIVTGFERDNLKEDLEEALREIEVLKNSIVRLKLKLSEFSENVNAETFDDYNETNNEYTETCNELKKAEDRRNILINCLKTPGEGEISVLQRIYPNTTLEIKKMIKDITVENFACSYYVIEGEWKQK